MIHIKKEQDKLIEFQTKLNYIFNDISLLKMALTHKSYAYESTTYANVEYNERIKCRLQDKIAENGKVKIEYILIYRLAIND